MKESPEGTKAQRPVVLFLVLLKKVTFNVYVFPNTLLNVLAFHHVKNGIICSIMTLCSIQVIC